MGAVVLDASVALIPILVFVCGLAWLDGYRLVQPALLLAALVLGALAAVFGLTLFALLPAGWWSGAALSAATVPLVEETAKAAAFMVLVLARRVGFLIDAAICAFAVGTGFALFENVVYLTRGGNLDLAVWAVRGVGTAGMHGSATALMAILAWSGAPGVVPGAERHLPGLGAAILLHAAFNALIIPPAAAAVVAFGGLPLLVALVYLRGEQHLQRWLAAGLDADAEMLRVIREGGLGETPVGRYIARVRDRFPASVVADMLCLLRLAAELSIEAKGLLMLRHAGFRVAASAEARDKLAEVGYLEARIGRAGRLVLRPLLPRSRRDAWQRRLLG